jgi:hypothetical protein
VLALRWDPSLAKVAPSGCTVVGCSCFVELGATSWFRFLRGAYACAGLRRDPSLAKGAPSGCTMAGCSCFVELGVASWFQVFRDPMLVQAEVGILRSQRTLPQDARWLDALAWWNMVQLRGSSSCGEPMLVLAAVGVLRLQRALPQDARWLEDLASWNFVQLRGSSSFVIQYLCRPP